MQLEWIKKNETIYACPVCNSEIEVEQGEKMPGYCKHCETEFEEKTETKYKLLKLVDGEWYVEGVYDTVTSLANAAYYLGKLGYEQIKVEIEVNL